MIFIGADNGVTAFWTILENGQGKEHFPLPVKKELSYTKAKAYISRVDYNALKTLLEPYSGTNTLLGIERPMVNPTRFQASISAVRCLEATLIILEELKIPYYYIDSKQWQKKFLPSGCIGTPELKKASKQIALRMHPELGEILDGDSVLIAEYMKQTYGEK